MHDHAAVRGVRELGAVTLAALAVGCTSVDEITGDADPPEAGDAPSSEDVTVPNDPPPVAPPACAASPGCPDGSAVDATRDAKDGADARTDAPDAPHDAAHDAPRG